MRRPNPLPGRQTSGPAASAAGRLLGMSQSERAGLIRARLRDTPVVRQFWEDVDAAAASALTQKEDGVDD